MSNSLIAEYRGYLAKNGQTDERPDWLLTRELGAQAEQNGLLKDYTEKYPDWAEQYGDFKHRNDPSFLGQVKQDVVRGYEKGMQGVDVLRGGADNAEDIAAREKIADKNKPGRDIQDFQEAPTLGKKLLIAAKNPIDVTAGLAAEGLGSSWPILAGTAVGGAAGAKAVPANPLARKIGAGVGAGVGAGLTAYSGRVLSALQEAGMDIKNPESIRSFFNDPAKLETAKEIAFRNAVPNAIFMGVTEGLAGKFIEPLKEAKAAGANVAKTELLKATGKEVGLQAAGGGASAAGADIAEGKPVDPGAVLAQGLGAVGFAPFAVASNLRGGVELPVRPGEEAVRPGASVESADIPFQQPTPAGEPAPVPPAATPVAPAGIDPTEAIADRKRELATLEPNEQLAALNELRAIPQPDPVQAGTRDWLESLQLDPVEAPAAAPAAPAVEPLKPAAPVEFLSHAVAGDAENMAWPEMWNLTKDLPPSPEFPEGAKAGSTVARSKLEALGYEVPATPKVSADLAAGTSTDGKSVADPVKPAPAAAAGPNPVAKNLPDWAREEMVRRGIDPNRSFTEMDLADPKIRAAIEADPTLSPADKQNILKYGQKTAPLVTATAKDRSSALKKLASTLQKKGSKLTTDQRASIETRLTSIAEMNNADAVTGLRGIIDEINPPKLSAEEQIKAALAEKPKETAPVAPEGFAAQPEVTPAVAAQPEVNRTTGFVHGPIHDGFADVSQIADVQSATPEQLVENADKYSSVLTEGSRTSGSSARQTSVAIALQAPDGTIVQRGLVPVSKTQAVSLVGDVPTKVTTGAAVQLMGKGKFKSIDAAGSKPVLLTDLFKAGYKPVGTVRFAGEPTIIRENFASIGEWRKALDLTEKVASKAPEKAAEALNTDKFATGDAAVAAAESQAARAGEGGASHEVEVQQYQERVAAIEKELEENEDLSSAQRTILRAERKELLDSISEAEADSKRAYRLTSEDPANPARPLTVDQVAAFDRVVDNLTALGVPVEKQAALTAGLDQLIKQEAGSYAQGANVIRLVMQDVTNADTGNLVTLFHEAAHMVLGNLTPEMRARVTKAAYSTFLEVANEKGYPIDQRPAERLAETFGQKLATEGFGAEGPTIAGRVMRMVQGLYYRAAIGMRAIFGMDPSEHHVLGWFENQLRRVTGGDYNSEYSEIINLPETMANRVQKFESVNQRGIPNVRKPWEDGFSQPEVSTDTVDGADESLFYRLPVSEEEFAKYPDAMARVNVAAQKTISAVLKAVFEKAGTKDQDIGSFWKNFAGKADLPDAIAAKMEERYPGAGQADSTTLETEAMQGKYTQQIAQVSRKLSSQARRTASNMKRRAAEAGDTLVNEARKYSNVEKLFKSADYMDAHLIDKTKEMIRGLGKDISTLSDVATASGGLAEAIRNAEKLTEGDAIPEDYQRVFKNIMDNKVPVFDYMQSLAKLNLDLGSMSVNEIWKAIKEHAPESKELRSLEQNRPLALALATLARNSSLEMNLLQLRVSTDAVESVAINKELDAIRSATKDKIAELSDNIDNSLEARSLRERLKRDYILLRARRNKLIRLVETSKTRGEQATHAAEAFEALSRTNEKSLGAFSDWEPSDGGEYVAMEQGEDGKWTATRKKLAMSGPDTLANAPIVMTDVRANTEWLMSHQEEKGSRLYNEIERHTTELALLDTAKRYDTYHNLFLGKMIAPQGEKYAMTGTLAGKNIQRRLLNFDRIRRSYGDSVEKSSRIWTSNFKDVVKASGYENYRHFLQEVYTPLMYAIESQPGLESDGQLYRFAARTARELMPKDTKLPADFDIKLARFLDSTKEASTKLVGIAEKEGVHVEDPRIKDDLRDSPTGGKRGVLRHALPQGWLTVPRRLERATVVALVRTMKEAGWTPTAMTDLAEALRELPEKPELAPVVEGTVTKLFTPGVVKEFVEPYMNKPGRPIFKGPIDAYGDRPRIDQDVVREVWHRSNGDVMQFISNLFDATNERAKNGEDKTEFTVNALRTMGALYRMELRLINDGEAKGRVRLGNATRSHTVMDARMNDIIPPEHFSYIPFDPANARIRMADIAYHSAFGRDGVGINNDLAALEAELGGKSQQYERIRRLPKAVQAAEAAKLGIDLKQAKKAHDQSLQAKGYEAELNTFLQGGNQLGARGDTGAALESVRAVVFGVLNQFSTALWNLASVADPTLVYRSLGPESVKASLVAAKNVFYNSAGSMLEAFGSNLLKSSEYARELGAFQGRDTSRLPLGVMLADIGKDGKVQDGPAQRLVAVEKAAMAAFKKGPSYVKDPQFANFNAVWGPLNFFSNQAQHAIAMSTVNTFEVMLRKAVKYFQANPDAMRAAQAGRFFFDAKKLGMDGPAFFNDKGTFDFFKEKLSDYRMGNLEKLALEAMPKAVRGERLLTTDHVLNLGMMAANEMSLESGVNARPIALSNSKFMQWVAPLLGWPISKMNQVEKALKNSDGRADLRSAMKGLAVLGMWSIPVGLGMSLAMDEWDKDVLKKKSNRRNIDPMAAVPVIGAAYYASSAKSAAAALERISRAGTFGLGGDLLNSLTNTVDPKSGQRDFDLNSRVLVYSMFDNLRQGVKNLISQEGAATYSSVWRPIIASFGGNGLIQYQQVLNNMLHLDNAEARVTKRINVGNWIRPAARDADLEMKSGEGKSASTPVSVQVREMQLAALANDPTGFLEAFRKATMEAARRGELDPERYVYQSYASRQPINSILEHKPSDVELARLYDKLGEEGRGVVAEAVALHERYADLIKPPPKRENPDIGGQIRREVTGDFDKMRRELNPRSAIFAN